MKTFITIASIIGAFLFTFGLVIPSIELGYVSFWQPKFESVKRKNFEQTKSYSYGMTADLSKYYSEFKTTEDPEGRLAIKELVRIRFSNFDKSVVNEPALENFLIECRGF